MLLLGALGLLTISLVTVRYRIREINLTEKPVFWGDGKVFSGEYLVNEGMNLSLRKVFASSVHVIEEVR